MPEIRHKKKINNFEEDFIETMEIPGDPSKDKPKVPFGKRFLSFLKGLFTLIFGLLQIAAFVGGAVLCILDLAGIAVTAYDVPFIDDGMVNQLLTFPLCLIIAVVVWLICGFFILLMNRRTMHNFFRKIGYELIISGIGIFYMLLTPYGGMLVYLIAAISLLTGAICLLLAAVPGKTKKVVKET